MLSLILYAKRNLHVAFDVCAQFAVSSNTMIGYFKNIPETFIKNPKAQNHRLFYVRDENSVSSTYFLFPTIRMSTMVTVVTTGYDVI